MKAFYAFICHVFRREHQGKVGDTNDIVSCRETKVSTVETFVSRLETLVSTDETKVSPK